MLTADWAVTIHPRWQRARPLLALPVWPFFAARALALRLVPAGAPLPAWLQVCLWVPGLLCLGIPTRIYELLGIVTLEADHD